MIYESQRNGTVINRPNVDTWDDEVVALCERWGLRRAHRGTEWLNGIIPHYISSIVDPIDPFNQT